LGKSRGESDWCGWCIRLDKEVFSQPEFVDYAKENVVLVKLDFPRDKPQSDAEKKQNE
jgi:protein disulfide-isomerase